MKKLTKLTGIIGLSFSSFMFGANNKSFSQLPPCPDYICAQAGPGVHTVQRGYDSANKTGKNMYDCRCDSKDNSNNQNSNKNNSNSGNFWDLLNEFNKMMQSLPPLPEPEEPKTDYSNSYQPAENNSNSVPEKTETQPKYNGGDFFSDEKTDTGEWYKENSGDKTNENSQWYDTQTDEKRRMSYEKSRAQSKELSDFVEKQAGYSPEAKAWFDKEHAKADAFYKEQCRINPEICDEIQKMDKLHKIIGYNAYQYGKEHTPAGPVIKGLEKVSDKDLWGEQSEKSEKFFGQAKEGTPENSWYHGTTQWQKDVKTGIYIVGDNFTPLVNGIEKAREFEEKGANSFWNEKIKEAEEYFNVKDGQMYIGPNKYNSASKYHQMALVVNYESSKIIPGGKQARELDKKGNWWDEK